MKKTIISIIAALLIGTIFGLVLFRNTKQEIENVFKENNILYLFQLGVYTNEENIKNVQKTYEGSIIIKDDIYFRLIFGVFTNKSAVNKMKDYLEENKIDYHIREITTENEDLIKELEKYEELLIQTTDTEVFLKTNFQILNSYRLDDINAN